MQPRTPWVEMHWSFELPPAWFPLLIERLRGTPTRAKALLSNVPDETARARVGEGWSMLDNAGHIGDLEPLWHGRLDDFDANRPELRPADLSNPGTWDAKHNDRPVADVLADLGRIRAALVSRLEQWGGETRWALTSNHPRLKTPMRVIDLAQFVADHDDYHMARIHQMKLDAGLPA